MLPKPLVKNYELSPPPPNSIVVADSIKVYGNGYAIFSNTLCGTEIKVFTHGVNRIATIRGLIKVLNKEGESTLFGITVSTSLPKSNTRGVEKVRMNIATILITISQMKETHLSSPEVTRDRSSEGG